MPGEQEQCISVPFDETDRGPLLVEEESARKEVSLLAGSPEWSDAWGSCVQRLLLARNGRGILRSVLDPWGKGCYERFAHPRFGFTLDGDGWGRPPSSDRSGIRDLRGSAICDREVVLRLAIEDVAGPITKKETAISGRQGDLRSFDAPERKKARKIVAHIHERIANRRLNFAHQTSRKAVDRFGTIVFEDLDITTMQKNPHLAKSIADVAWNQFITITGSKAEEAGSRVILVNPRNTSQMCSRCGMIVAKTLSDRVHLCPQCGLVLDRIRTWSFK
jgi:IS605 OrfB family transposase